VIIFLIEEQGGILKMKKLIKKTVIKSGYIATMLLLLFLAGIYLASAAPPEDFDSVEMYRAYEDGYKAGKKILKKEFRDTSLLEGCIRISDHTLWKNKGWDKQISKKAEKMYFYGCTNSRSKKMTKKEFMEKYIWQ
jgi:hypothetical protein